MSSGFIQRAYDGPRDENGVYYLWFKSYAHSRFGRRIGADRDASADELAYIENMRPLIAWHLENTEVALVCSAAKPDIIYGFASTTGDVVHYAMVKHSVKRDGFTRDVLELLLGDRLRRKCAYTSDLVELRKTGTLPLEWYLDEFWYLRSALGRRAA